MDEPEDFAWHGDQLDDETPLSPLAPNGDDLNGPNGPRKDPNGPRRDLADDSGPNGEDPSPESDPAIFDARLRKLRKLAGLDDLKSSRREMRRSLAAELGMIGEEMSTEERRLIIAELHRKGYSAWEISCRIGITPQGVAKHLKAIKEMYRRATLEQRQALVNEKLDQYADIRKEAWEAWEKSKEDAVRETVEEIETELGGRTRTVVTREGRLPGNEYLRTIHHALEAERDLQGIDAPKKVNVDQTINWDVFADPSKVLETPVVDEVELEILAIENNSPLSESGLTEANE